MWRLLKPLLLASLAFVTQRAFCTGNNHVVSIDDEACPSGVHTLLTGRPSDYYYKVGQAIKKVAEEQCNKAPTSSCLRICVKENDQTLDNIQMLAHKDVDFAIVQGDVAHDAWYGHPLPLGENLQKGGRANIPIDGVKAVKLVTPLYVEAVHILLRPHLNISNLGELRGLKIWLGPHGSGTEYTATRLLRGAGFSLGECEPVDHKYEETDALVVTCIKDIQLFSDAIGQLNPGGLDALFKIGPVPTRDIEDSLLTESAAPDETSPHRSDYQLLPVDYDLASKFVQDRSYVYRLIQADDYKQAQSTLSIGVPALLLTNLSNDDENVARLAQLVREQRKRIEDIVADIIAQEEPTAGHRHELRLDLLNVPVPVKTGSFVHEKARPYLYHSGKEWPFRIILLAVFVVLCFLVGWLGKMTFKQFVMAPLLGHSLVISLLLFSLVCSGGALYLQHYEGSVNEGFRSFSMSVWSTICQALPFMRSQMITPLGESRGSIIAWAIRVLFLFGVARSLKEKFAPVSKRWESASEQSGQRREFYPGSAPKAPF